jgi:hypothetical protein
MASEKNKDVRKMVDYSLVSGCLGMCGLEMDHRGTKCGDVVHIEDNPII